MEYKSDQYQVIEAVNASTKVDTKTGINPHSKPSQNTNIIPISMGIWIKKTCPILS
jgi:hypothetical protein